MLLNQLKQILIGMSQVVPTYNKLNPHLPPSVLTDISLYLAVALHLMGERNTNNNIKNNYGI
jgi:hypothetical protein